MEGVPKGVLRGVTRSRRQTYGVMLLDLHVRMFSARLCRSSTERPLVLILTYTDTNEWCVCVRVCVCVCVCECVCVCVCNYIPGHSTLCTAFVDLLTVTKVSVSEAVVTSFLGHTVTRMSCNSVRLYVSAHA